MKRLKKKTVLVGLMALLLFSVASTLVYGGLKKDDSVLNRLAIGHLKGEIRETFDGDLELVTQIAYPKEVTVKNTGNLNLFVRVMIFPEIISQEGIALGGNIGQEIESEIGTDWLYGEDGYYYYLGKLAKGKTTSPIFSQLTLADSSLLSDNYQGATLTIQLKSETITSADLYYRQAWWHLDQQTPPLETSQLSIDKVFVTLVDQYEEDL